MEHRKLDSNFYLKISLISLGASKIRYAFNFQIAGGTVQVDNRYCCMLRCANFMGCSYIFITICK